MCRKNQFAFGFLQSELLRWRKTMKMKYLVHVTVLLQMTATSLPAERISPYRIADQVHDYRAVTVPAYH